MLDDLKYIHIHDPQDALGISEKQSQQLKVEFDINAKQTTVNNVVLAGMGGSALAGLITQKWLDLPVPMEIVRDYTLPAYVSDATLFIASSYSGNTEETLHALVEAEAKGANIIIIASDGELTKFAQDKGYPTLKLPVGYQPRYATLFTLKALAKIFDSYNLSNKATDLLVSRQEFIDQTAAKLRPDVPTKENKAKQIALELVGKSIVVYSGPLLYPVAYKWKINFNEDAKHLAWVNQYPEFNHNEFLGWTKQPVDKPYAVIDLRSNLDIEHIRKRFELTEKLLSGLRPSPIVVSAEGSNLLDQLLWTLVLGDFVSLYLALLNGINPTPVDMIEEFKHELAE
ncbi:MAG TPA: bifunctional phosphoglucose/phosphomannose isomerase [Candidatus Saccharimonadales bacterium]|jgi:glucose/mannose-6-phosphate isomerase|nr:bifunctional phosphoglucose/phosphomannose isomerase [Candidatus Saccharimonadales bacterium]